MLWEESKCVAARTEVQSWASLRPPRSKCDWTVVGDRGGCWGQSSQAVGTRRVHDPGLLRKVLGWGVLVVTFSLSQSETGPQGTWRVELEARALRREGVFPGWGSIMGPAEGQVWWVGPEEGARVAG